MISRSRSKSHTHACKHSHRNTCAHKPAYMYMHTHHTDTTYTHAHTLTPAHTCTHLHICTCTHTTQTQHTPRHRHRVKMCFPGNVHKQGSAARAVEICAPYCHLYILYSLDYYIPTHFWDWIPRLSKDGPSLHFLPHLWVLPPTPSKLDSSWLFTIAMFLIKSLTRPAPLNTSRTYLN